MTSSIQEAMEAVQRASATLPHLHPAQRALLEAFVRLREARALAAEQTPKARAA